MPRCNQPQQASGERHGDSPGILNSFYSRRCIYVYVVAWSEKRLAKLFLRYKANINAANGQVAPSTPPSLPSG